MPETVTAKDLSNRLESVIQGKFKGNVSAFGRACNKIDGSVDGTNVRSLIARHSMPRFDIVAVFAKAAGVSLDWLAGVKTDKPYIDPKLTQEPIGTPRVREFASEYSVESEGKPEPTVYPGFQIGDQLTIDFIVRGKSGRQVIHAGPKDTGNDK